MNCAKHPDMTAGAYCRTCGKALCETCKRDVRGVIYCEDCLANRLQAQAAARPAAPPAPVPGGSPHPAVAGVLAGFFPFGVGQAYNGQYARGFVYLIVFIALVWAVDRGPTAAVVFGLGIAGFYFFQLIDAVRSANHIRLGQPAPDPFGLDNLFGAGGRPTVAAAQKPAAAPVVPPTGGAPAEPLPVVSTENGCCPGPSHAVPLGALILIIIGVLFLVGNLGYMHFHWFHELWPLILVAIGVWLLVDRWPMISTASPRGRRLLMGPVVLLVLGGTFLLDSLDRVSFSSTWPLILIAIGLVLMWQRIGSGPPPLTPPSSPTDDQARSETSVGQQESR